MRSRKSRRRRAPRRHRSRFRGCSVAKPCRASFSARATRTQLDDNLKAAELKLDAVHRAELDEASAIDLGYPYQFMNDIQGRW